MLNQFSRTELLLGKDGIEKLASSRVAIFGIGGVGGYTVEALARSGVGTFDLIDDDTAWTDTDETYLTFDKPDKQEKSASNRRRR